MKPVIWLSLVLLFGTFGCVTDKPAAPPDSPAPVIVVPPVSRGYPYAIKTETAGVVKSPYAVDRALVDVSQFSTGDLARCPHTGKIFVVP